MEGEAPLLRDVPCSKSGPNVNGDLWLCTDAEQGFLGVTGSLSVEVRSDPVISTKYDLAGSSTSFLIVQLTYHIEIAPASSTDLSFRRPNHLMYYSRYSLSTTFRVFDLDSPSFVHMFLIPATRLSTVLLLPVTGLPYQRN